MKTKSKNKKRLRIKPIPIDILIRSAQNGDSEAQFTLGLKYFVGSEVEKNNELACKWFQKAKEQGHPKAGHFLVLVTQKWG